MAAAVEAELARLVMQDPDFAEIETRLDLFCPFEAIGMVRQEIRHGSFFAYLLQPQRPHGFGVSVLAALLRAVAGLTQTALQPLDVHFASLDDAIVYREWQHIDLLVDLPAANIVIAIELKIDASETPHQLQSYRKAVDDHWPNRKKFFVFLTANGDESQHDPEYWQPLALADFVSELGTLCDRGLGSEAARALLRSYIDMVRRHILSDERLESLAAALWARHRNALEFLRDREPNALNDRMKELGKQANDIAEELYKKTTLDIVLDSTAGNSMIRFAVKNWDNLEGMRSARDWTPSNRLILAELQARRGVGVSAYVVLGRGETEARQRLFDTLSDGGCLDRNRQGLTPEWTRLASRTLWRARGPTPEPPSVDALIKAFVDFIGPKLIEYNRALRAEPAA
jgi:hypothetical protein